jgi:hypothetical protein
MRPAKGTCFLKRRFTGDDQNWFASLSGDFNPIHVDPIEARRTIAGGAVVHGVHSALVALEALTERILSSGGNWPKGIAGLTVKFPRPVLVGDTVRYVLHDSEGDSATVHGSVGSGLVLDMKIRVSEAPKQGDLPASWPPLDMVDCALDDFSTKQGKFAIGLDTSLAGARFPALLGLYGAGWIGELVALSRLVGMVCPGRHSLFGQFEVGPNGSGNSGWLSYTSLGIDERFNRIELSVDGAVMAGRVRAFMRPPPQTQPDIASIASLVEPGRFSETVALIVGGTRGLGEVTAKAIAAGGGEVIITYNQGRIEARKIQAEISSQGGKCRIYQLDATKSPRTLSNIFKRHQNISSFYYFATTKISGRRRGLFDAKLVEEFIIIYATYFSKALEIILGQNRVFTVFYPSSITIDENPKELAEYVIAKKAAEDICAYYSKFSNQLNITVRRLPRIRTDQTATLTEIDAENAVDVMLPIIDCVEQTR